MARSKPPTTSDLREQILADFATLKVPLASETFDAALAAPITRACRICSSCTW